VRDDFGTVPVAHSADMSNGGTNDIVDAAGCEANGKTYLESVIPLDSGDPADKPLVPGSTYKALIACHETDDEKPRRVAQPTGLRQRHARSQAA